MAADSVPGAVTAFSPGQGSDENDVARPGVEEQLDNEKYQFRPRDYTAALASGASLAPYLTRLNAIRAAHPAIPAG